MMMILESLALISRKLEIFPSIVLRYKYLKLLNLNSDKAVKE
jgi:hypothetical protein